MTLAIPVTTDPTAPTASAPAARPLAAAADQGQGGRDPARPLRAGRHHRPAGHALRSGLPEPVAGPVHARPRRGPPARHHARAGRTCCPSCWSASGSTLELALLVGVDRHRAVGLRRRHGGLPRRGLGRVPVPGLQRVPGHPGAAAADPAAGLPAAEGPAGHDPGAQRARLAVGRAGDPRADAGHPQPGLRRRLQGDRREHLADHHLRDHPERDQPDRGQLREHGALRDRGLGRAGLHRPGQPDQLEPGHHALLGARASRPSSSAPGGGSRRRAWPWR